MLGRAWALSRCMYSSISCYFIADTVSCYVTNDSSISRCICLNELCSEVARLCCTRRPTVKRRFVVCCCSMAPTSIKPTTVIGRCRHCVHRQRCSLCRLQAACPLCIRLFSRGRRSLYCLASWPLTGVGRVTCLHACLS